jgi:hypothetical protein
MVKIYEVGGVWKPIYSLSGISRTTAPSSPGDGQFWYDSTVKILKHWNGSEWIPIYSSTSLTNEIAPTSPKTGQLWYRASLNTLYVYNGTQWTPIFTGNSISFASAPSTPVRGQLWFDTVNNILKIYDNTNAFVPISGGAISIVGDLNMNSYHILNLANGVNATDGINKGQLDSAISGVNTSITNLTNSLADLKVFRVYQDNPASGIGVSGNGWIATPFAGVGSATSWPAAWAPWFPYITSTYDSSGVITVTGPVGKNYRVAVIALSAVAAGNDGRAYNVGFKMLVDGNFQGSGLWNSAGDVGFAGGGGDHGWGCPQQGVAQVTCEAFSQVSSLSQTFTGTHTFEFRTYGVCTSYPGTAGYVIVNNLTLLVYTD